MSYEDGDSLEVRIQIAFGALIGSDPGTWTWTDVTAWWHTPDEVTIGWGRSAGAEQPETSTLSLTLKNHDGRFTARDGRSPYWPNVRRWTPIQYDIDLGDGEGWRNRFSGYVRRWPLTWPGASPMMALARIEAVGVLGRLARGKPPARSAMRRSIPAGGPVAYWPVEDGVSAGQAAATTASVPPMVTGGTVTFRPVDDTAFTAFGNTTVTRWGTSAIANLAAGGSLSAQLPAQATTACTTAGAWSAQVFGRVDNNTLLAAADVVILQLATPAGSHVRWHLVAKAQSSTTQVIAYAADGTATTVINWPSSYPGLNTWWLSIRQVGGNVEAAFGVGGPGNTVATGSVAGTMAGPTQVAVNPTLATSSIDMPAGHVGIWSSYGPPPWRHDFQTHPDYGGYRGADEAYQAEVAHVRLERLAAEDGITVAMPVVAADAAVRMGWQPAETSLALCQQCEAADGGLIYEDGFGLGYLPRAARFNAPVALTIDADAGQLGAGLSPVDDDQQLRNVWTVERIEGSSSTAVDQDAVDEDGEIEGSARLSLSTDDPLPDQAGWRLHLSTVAEPRYPAIGVNIAAHREVAAAWCDCRPGSRINVINPPEQNVPGVVDQVVVGASETYRGRRSWRVTMSTLPARPWDVAVVDGADQRVAADGSTLAADLTASGMSLSLASTASNGVWTVDPADMPLDVRVGGERVTLSAISGGTSPQTATISARAVNGVARAWPSGTEVDVWNPAILAL